MKRLRTFLTPGWVLAAVVAVAFTYLAFTVLAPWQLGKNEAVQARNHHLQEAFDTPPVPAAEVFRDGGIRAEDEWRRVIVRGEYLPDKEVVLRNRPVDQAPAVQALTVFRTDDGREMLVNRGWAHPTDGGVPDYPAAPSGEVELRAYARVNEVTPERDPIVGDGPIQVYGIDTAQISDLLDVELGRDWLQLAADQPGSLMEIPLPALTSGPHLSYGIQWIFFGIAAPAAVIWFVFAEVRERRREREEQEEHEEFLRRAAAGARSRDDAPSPATATPAATAAPADGASGGDAGRGAATAVTAEDVPERAGAATAAEPEMTEEEKAEAERARRMARRYGESGHNLDLQRSRRRRDRF
ncbi:SURF1 family cytochrome oxidase biogenesis protein [Corynebacterium sp. 335C]